MIFWFSSQEEIIENVKCCIRRGVNINQEVVELLLNKGVDPNGIDQGDDYNRTSVVGACSKYRSRDKYGATGPAAMDIRK